MQSCFQNDKQSIYDHGVSVKEKLFQLINYLNTKIIHENWKLPDWLFLYKDDILKSLYSENILEKYAIFHDCGKAYCLSYDENGKKHFINHAEISYNKWLEIGGDQVTANLIKMDMDIHLLKTHDIDEFCKREQAVTLLLTGLAEIHANAEMFGGINSTSFKIKYKQIDRRGRVICQKLFKKEK